MKNLDNIKYFVFSGGKTGSSTIYHGFENKFGADSTLHVHSNLEFKKNYPKKGDLKNLIIHSKKKNDKIYIIDSYREPFERSIASFFENIRLHCPNWKNMNIEEIIDFFNTHRFYLLDSYQSYHESWGYFGISTNDVEFDFDKGYILSQYENIIFIKTRLNESFRWDTIFSKIIGSDIVFSHENNSENKEYSEKYKKFKELYKLPNPVKNEFLELLNNPYLDSKIFENFYLSISEMLKFMTQKEIKNYLNKWIY